MTEVDWPDVKVTGGGRPVSASSYVAVVGHGMIPKGTETYLALSKVRERLLSKEAIKAAVGRLDGSEDSLIGYFYHAEEVAEEQLAKALSRALAAAFPRGNE